jgi:hypothetical protein
VTTDGAPTMVGFEWSETEAFVPTVPGENGWCVRDAICQLFGWSSDSDEWKKFIEGPQGKDTDRLADHLGLTLFRVDVPQDFNQLITRLDHPGIAIFVFDEAEMSHVVYVPDLAWLTHHWPSIDGQPAKGEDRELRWYGWPLGPQHMARGPVLGAVLVDERLPPRGR